MIIKYLDHVPNCSISLNFYLEALVVREKTVCVFSSQITARFSYSTFPIKYIPHSSIKQPA